MCPVDQAEYLSHLRDFSLAGDEAYDVDAAVEHRDAGHQSLDARTCAVDIQDGDYYRAFVCGTLDKLRNGVYGVTFDADEDDVCLAVCRRGGGKGGVLFGGIGGYLQRMFAFQVGVQAKPVSAQGGEVLAACDAGDVFSGKCQESGYRPAYAAGAGDEVFQRFVCH